MLHLQLLLGVVADRNCFDLITCDCLADTNSLDNTCDGALDVLFGQSLGPVSDVLDQILPHQMTLIDLQ